MASIEERQRILETTKGKIITIKYIAIGGIPMDREVKVLGFDDKFVKKRGKNVHFTVVLDMDNTRQTDEDDMPISARKTYTTERIAGALIDGKWYDFRKDPEAKPGDIANVNRSETGVKPLEGDDISTQGALVGPISHRAASNADKKRIISKAGSSMFQVGYYKSDGTFRAVKAKLGVAGYKGGKLRYKPGSSRIVIFDMEAAQKHGSDKAHRTLLLSNISWVLVNGELYDFRNKPTDEGGLDNVNNKRGKKTKKVSNYTNHIVRKAALNVMTVAAVIKMRSLTAAQPLDSAPSGAIIFKLSEDEQTVQVYMREEGGTEKLIDSFSGDEAWGKAQHKFKRMMYRGEIPANTEFFTQTSKGLVPEAKDSFKVNVPEKRPAPGQMPAPRPLV